MTDLPLRSSQRGSLASRLLQLPLRWTQLGQPVQAVREGGDKVGLFRGPSPKGAMGVWSPCCCLFLHTALYTHTHTHTHTHTVLVCLGCHKKVQTGPGGLTQHTFIYSQLWRSEYKISLWAGVAFPKVIVPGWQMTIFLLCLFALPSLCVSVS